MAETYEQLRDLTREQLVKEYDKIAKNTQIGLNFLREEIARRDAEEQTAQMLTMTRQMRTLTVVIAVLTVINVIAVFLSLFAK